MNSYRNLDGTYVSWVTMIYIIQRELHHYRIPFFLELKKYYDIRVLYARSCISGNWKDVVSEEKIFKRVNGLFPTTNPYFSLLQTTLEIVRGRPDIIIHEMSLSIMNVYFMPLLARILKIKLIWWSHGYNRMDKQGQKKVKCMIRVLINKMADASIVYSEKGKEFLVRYGVKSDKVFAAWNSIDTAALSMRDMQGDERRKEKGVCFLFMGRLTDDKKPLFAAELFRRIASKYPECSFHFIGGGEQEGQLGDLFYGQICHRVFIHGEITDPEALSCILQQCDILVNPGYLGLNVIHALAFGIPAMAVNDGNDGVFHSPEFEYIENTGAFIPVDCLNIDEFENCCIRLIEDREMLEKAKISAKKCFRRVSMARMVGGFMEAVEASKKEKVKR